MAWVIGSSWVEEWVQASAGRAVVDDFELGFSDVR
jgi:hypothetical protein